MNNSKLNILEDLCKDLLTEDIRLNLNGFKVIMRVHDETVVEAPYTDGVPIKVEGCATDLCTSCTRKCPNPGGALECSAYAPPVYYSREWIDNNSFINI